jgi:aryl-alcohol dehydrogenase-like predicted oxidoreductase
MKYTRLGRTGLQVSRLCLGTMTFGWSSDEATSFAIMDKAFDNGLQFFDTADIYSSWANNEVGGQSETIIGKWLKNKDRRQVVIATKVRGTMWKGANGDGLSRHHIKHAVEDSLRRLQTDYIDLYQTHWTDDDCTLEETMRALDDLIRDGKVLYLGCSNYRAWELIKALWVSDKHGYARYDCIQPHHSLFRRQEFEAELESACLDQQIAVIPYSPLAAGFATGKYTRANRQPDSTRLNSGLIKELVNNDRAYDVLDVLQDIATAHDAPVAHIALAWSLARPAITSPIIGARTVAQLEEALGAEEIVLSADEIQRINVVSAKVHTTDWS